MKLLHHVVWLILIAILQPALINALSVFGVNGNVFLLFIVLIGFFCGRMQGMLCGILFGLVYDIYVGRFIGTDMLIYLFIGYFSAVVSDSFYGRPNIYVFSAMAAGATIAAEIIYLIPYSMFCEGSFVWISAVRIIFIETVLNAVLVLPMLWFIEKTLVWFKIKKY